MLRWGSVIGSLLLTKTSLQALSQTAQAKNLASRRQASSEMVISSSKAIAAFVHFHYHLDAQVLVATPLYFYV